MKDRLDRQLCGSEPPPRLAVVNIHPDYLDVCVEKCCTGSRRPCRLPKGTVACVRRTGGGRVKRYGVIGVWYFTGKNEPVPRFHTSWPLRWDNRADFLPLVQRFKTPFCEDFSVPTPARPSIKSSLYVRGLVQGNLQGGIVTIIDKVTAANYVQALLKARAGELDVDADYFGSSVNVAEFLAKLAQRLRE